MTLAVASLGLDVLLDNLATIEGDALEGILHMTQANFDAFNAAGGGLLSAWDAELGHHVPGPGARAGELSGLRQLFNSGDSDKETIADLRWRLVNELRDGTLSLDDERLKEHLRNTVVNQIAIDQPRYSGFTRSQTF